MGRETARQTTDDDDDDGRTTTTRWGTRRRRVSVSDRRWGANVVVDVFVRVGDV
jgi:hypothetical protein